MKQEIQGYADVLLGREDPPVDKGVLTLFECAEAFHSRAREMEMNLLNAEAEGAVLKGSNAYKFRTGALRSFIEMARGAMDLGSRRVTQAIAVAEGKL